MKSGIIATTIALGLATATHASPLTNIFTSYYAFGDSLSDNGKVGPGVLSAPSLDGRFSNGKVWTEILADDFEAAGNDNQNYAIGGATAGPVDTPRTPISTFAGQIQAFSANLFLDTAVPPFFDAIEPGSNPLASVWFGANDLFNTLEGETRLEDARRAANLLTQQVAGIATATRGLFDDFIIPNLPNLGLTPSYALFDTANQENATNATLAFNAQLKSNIADLRNAGLNIYTIDTLGLFDAVLNDPLGPEGIYDFANVTLPCTISFASDIGTNCVTDGGLTLGQVDSFLFADAVHPTAATHRILAEQAQAAVVPLPASAFLLLTGFGLIGVVAKRRRAA
ncbi:VPLPA-CTERM sorting domain-containing protein [Roseobacter sp. YSTF-M11]|uniref:VPLPA-CTERM sorting domain-containing protein n=1 Tax=Roseobacter insulae TaxID=2859783 RepID=A0A9X1FSW0_9RHOB|nr:SGNH/GDSL hydrolase family protein [Roseobacter insulae]MBW4706525.1 VPLPA-CTERM sorting domain-containing protein [Roseobacter insulae]